MPWCEQCARFFNPTAMGKAGECPVCGRVIGAAPKAPWHFKFFIGAASLYLGWRVVQGLDWLFRQMV